MKAINENYNEYVESNSESLQSEIDTAIDYAKSDLNDLQAEILSGTKVDFKTPDSINNFYRLEGNNIIFQIDQVRSYLADVLKRLQGMKVQKFSEVSKEKNFKGTILAIQIALKALSRDPKNPKDYNVGNINGEYNDTTKEAIKRFQSDQKIENDGKPGKGTIEKILKSIDTLTNNKKNVELEYQALIKDVENIIEESVRFNPYSGLHTKDSKKLMAQYIMDGKLGTMENSILESQISSLSNHNLNRKLKYLLNHPNEPIKDVIKNLKNEEIRKTTPASKSLENINLGGKKNKKETVGQLPWSLSNYPYNGRTFNKYTYGNDLTEGQKNEIDNRLKKVKSPLTVEMFQKASIETKVPVEFILAFCQNDSTYGTIGDRTKRTKNPGNVGNDDAGNNTYYKTREEGVIACGNHIQRLINKYFKFFNQLPTISELATGIGPKNKQFHGVYMSSTDGQVTIKNIFSSRVSRLKGK